MKKMSQTEEDTKEPNLSTSEEENQPMNTVLEILQNECMNCERDISLEKSIHEQDEGKFECALGLKDVSNQITPDCILTKNEKLIGLDENLASSMKDIFSNDQYCELIDNIIRIGNHFNEIKEDDVQKIIFEYAEVNEIGHDFDKTSRRTGNEWYQQFIRLHPQLNSVMKKSSNDCVQMDEADSSFSSRIVDKFLSDYKKIRKNDSKPSEYGKKFKPEMTSSESESCDFPGKQNTLTVEGVIEAAVEIATGSNKLYSNTTTENFGVTCFADTPNCVESFKNEEFFNPVSSVYSKNECLVNECSLKRDDYINDENTLNESNEKWNVTFENMASMKDDENDLLGVNLGNSITNALPILINDSCKTPLENSVITKNDCSFVEKTNISTRKNTSCGETMDVTSTEAVGTETRANKGNDVTNETDCENNESCDIKNHSDGSVIFSENTNCLSGPETSRFIGNASESLEKMKNTGKKSSFVNNISISNISTDLDTFSDKKSDDITSLNVSPSSIQSALKRKEEVSIGAEGESEEKKPKISKKKRPPSQRKIKISKYLYKLKSYSGSVLYFTSSTSVNFIKPVIKLTKLDESSCEDVVTNTTSATNATTPLESNHIDDVEMNSYVDDEFQAQADTKQNSVTGSVLEDYVGTELNSDPGNNLSCPVEAETSASPNNSVQDEMEPETNSSSNHDVVELVEAETNLSSNHDLIEQVQPEANIGSDHDSVERVQSETNLTSNRDLEEQVQPKANIGSDHDSVEQVQSETNLTSNRDLEEQVQPETNFTSDHDLIEQVQPETNLSSNHDLVEHVELKTNPSSDGDVKKQSEEESQSTSINESKCEIEEEINSKSDDLKTQVVKTSETPADRNVNGPNNKNKDATPKLKMSTSEGSITPTFGMQTRRKRLKFLPDGTLVTPNQKYQRFSDEFSSTLRSESKMARKRSLKTSSLDNSKSEKKIKTVSAPASSTPKQSSRSALSAKKVSKNQPDRYIPKPNGQSKKPQKIFDYDSYYRENFRQTEVKLPQSCKKQMVALSRVTSISPGAQSGSPFTVNPSQLLSCLLSMPITPDQIRTVRFKPSNKQLKPNKQVNITPAKLASNNTIKPITKRHLELLQKTPFNIVPKTEIGIAKAAANSKSQSTA